MKKLSGGLVFIALLTSYCFAGNLGYVTGVQLITGTNGKKYIEVSHSGYDVSNVAYWNTQQIWDPVYIAWDDNADVTNAINWANMLKSLSSNHTITIEVTSGSSIGPNAAIPTYTVQVYTYKLVCP